MIMHELAVVPILTNAGVAVLPAILAGIGSTVALLFKPRELAALLRRRPHVLFITIAVLGAVAALISWLASPANNIADRPAVVSTIDWHAVALEILRDERLAGVATQPADPNTTSTAEPFNHRGNFARTGWLGSGAPRRLIDRWEVDTNAGFYYLADAAIHGDRIFAAGCLQDVSGLCGSLSCIDSRGKVIWNVTKLEKDSLKGFFSSPSISADGRSLLIGQGLHTDKDCSLLCFDTDSGKLRWQTRVPLNHIEGSPAIHGDMVVVGAGAIEKDDGSPPRDGTGVVIAVRISTGEKLWECNVIDPESSPAIGDDGTVYIGSGVGGNAVVALRPQSDDELKASGTPRVLWSRPLDYPAVSAVTIAGDKLLIGTGRGDFVKAAAQPAGEVVCLELKTGTVVWQTLLDDVVLGAIAVSQRMAFAPVRSGEIVALDLESGGIRWRQQVSDTAAPVLASPAVAANVVYAVANDGTLALFDRDSGKPLDQKYQVNAAAAPGVEGLSCSSPIIAGGQLYVGSETGGLRCFVGSTEGK